MKTIIAGSREGVTKKDVEDAIKLSGFEITSVVSGGARGVDKHGEDIAKVWSWPIYQFLPNYERYGIRAPFARNSQMADNAEALIAVWNGESRGTQHMIKVATQKGLKVFVHCVSHD